MNRHLVRLTVALALCSSSAFLGCGSTTTPAVSASAAAATPASEVALEEGAGELASAQATDSWAAEAPAPHPERRLEGLPEAPWRASALSPSEVPQELLSAWSQAPNRGWCAPLTPATLGAAEGATARSASLLGGWSVEFDRAGLPGVDAEGEVCQSCGRGVFGIAGTVLAAEDMDGEGEEGEEGFEEAEAGAEAGAEGASFADGSRAEIEASEEAATATITVAGEGCVYQVWSFLGEAHLRELVGSLRRVQTQGQALAGL